MANYRVLSDVVQWRNPEARRVALILADPPDNPDGWQSVAAAVVADLVRGSAVLLVYIYPTRQAVGWDGWIARITVSGGRVAVYTDNDPDGKRALMESIRED